MGGGGARCGVGLWDAARPRMGEGVAEQRLQASLLVFAVSGQSPDRECRSPSQRRVRRSHGVAITPTLRSSPRRRHRNHPNAPAGDADAYGVIADCFTDLGEFEKAAAFYDRYIDAMSKDGPV